MDDRGRKSELAYPPGRHEAHAPDGQGADDRRLSGEGRQQHSRRPEFRPARRQTTVRRVAWRAGLSADGKMNLVCLRLDAAQDCHFTPLRCAVRDGVGTCRRAMDRLSDARHSATAEWPAESRRAGAESVRWTPGSFWHLGDDEREMAGEYRGGWRCRAVDAARESHLRRAAGEKRQKPALPGPEEKPLG